MERARAAALLATLKLSVQDAETILALELAISVLRYEDNTLDCGCLTTAHGQETVIDCLCEQMDEDRDDVIADYGDEESAIAELREQKRINNERADYARHGRRS